MKSDIGIDSQCLSYLIDILGVKPLQSDALLEQQLALVRIYFYREENFWVTPTVTLECSKIRNLELEQLHSGSISSLFGERRLNNSVGVIEKRVNELFQFHAKKNDCMVLAEAEDIEFNIFLTFDKRFQKNLGVHALGLRIMKPSEYWKELDIPKESTPKKAPCFDHPLFAHDFWRW